MEKAHGVRLDIMWNNMPLGAKCELIKSIGRIQKAWASTSFSQYGSLYYATDIVNPGTCVRTKQDGSQIEERRFAVGPSTGRSQLDYGRMAVDFDRGPCKLMLYY